MLMTSDNEMSLQKFIFAAAEQYGVDTVKYYPEIWDTIDNIAAMYGANGITPDMVFDFVENGWGKEVYESPFGDCQVGRPVLKFVATHNQTEDEMEILRAAQTAGLDELFMPTHIFRLSRHKIFSNVLSDMCYKAVYCDTIMIQPRLIYSYNTVRNTPPLKEKFLNSPITSVLERDGYYILKNGVSVTLHNIDALDLPNSDFFCAILDSYGHDVGAKLLDFCIEYDIHDLHAGNIGWLRSANGGVKPTIVDWISSSPYDKW